MGEDRPEPSVQYVPDDSSIKLLERLNAQGTFSESRKAQKTHRRRKTTFQIIWIVLSVCLIIAGPALTFFWLRHVDKVPSPGEHSMYSILGDVSNLTLDSIGESSFTVTWEPPEDPFDYYLVEVTEDGGNIGSKTQTHLSGSCAKDTIIYPDQTRITCSYQEACAMASFTVRTYRKGPPEVISRGSTIDGIVIPAQDPDPPQNLTIIGIAPTLTRLQWEPPHKLSGTNGQYIVRVCDNSTPCDAAERFSGCMEHETATTWLEIESTVNTTYCVLATVSTMCGTGILRSRPAMLEFRTPLFDLPDVTHLQLLSSAGNSFTATWERPETDFDYYTIEITVDSGDSSTEAEPYRVGSCASGTIIHRDLTRVTCSVLKACTIATFTVRTYRRGPPELTSMGSTLHDIFIPGQDPDPPGNMTIIRTLPSLTRLQWKPPTNIPGSIHSYVLKICTEFTSCNSQASVVGCSEHHTWVAWLEFASTADTSYCVLATAGAQCGWNILWSSPTEAEFRTPSFVLPDVVNLRLVSTAANTFTATWERPDADFDYFTIEVGDKTGTSGPSEPRHGGSCANGAIIHPNRTSVTCSLLEACTNATFTVRTYRSGPPALSSLGNSLQNIFIPGEEPDPPRSLTTSSKSPSLSKVQWEPPAKASDHLSGFTVTICAGYTSCGPQLPESGCTEHQTSDTWMEFESIVDTPYCVQVKSRVRCGLDELWSVPVRATFRTPLFELPDVTNLTLVATADRAFTVSWEPPEIRFDYYRVEVITNDIGGSGGSTKPSRESSCATGTIVHSDNTEVTCSFLEACSNVSFRVQTCRSGPPELTSSGIMLQGILIPSEGPDPPRSVSITGISSYLTRLQWTPPFKVPTSTGRYMAKVCQTFSTCSAAEDMAGCIEQDTSHTWLEFQSNPDTPYCALVSTVVLCNGDVLTSRPATEIIRTPVFELPDVSNLTLVSAEDNSFTVAWERPAVRFDYYTVRARGHSTGVSGDKGTASGGSCATGTILHPDQTRITCSNFDSCSAASFTVHTYIKGPPEVTSAGVTLSDIIIGGQEPEPPSSINMVAIAPSLTRLQWNSPEILHASTASYTVKVCDVFTSCAANESMSGCFGYETPATHLEFESTVNTTYCVLVIASTNCGANIPRSRPETAKFTTPVFVLPDVGNLSLESAGDQSFTVAWERPEARFDYYIIEVAGRTDDISSPRERQRGGSCASGTIIHPNQTRVTCSLQQACSEASFTVRTYDRGPPERLSLGATLHTVFIPGRDPGPPRGVAMFGIAPSRTRLEWKPPSHVSGSIQEYTVKVCDTFTSCDEQQISTGCLELNTTATWLEFQSTADTRYCFLFTATARCGNEVLRSRPEAAEFRTPLFELPDVVNLTLESTAKNSFTMRWEQPEGPFDYYRIQLSVESNNSSGHSEEHRGVSCTTGSLVHRDQTKVTCLLDSCSTASFTLRTFKAGPPELISMGATVKDIFIPGQVPSPPLAIYVAWTSPSLTRLQWKPPDKVSGLLTSYTLNISENFTACTPEGMKFGCTEHESLEPWLEFESVVDTRYCVVVSASAQCGSEVLSSSPTAAEIRTPLFALPDVANLSLVSAGDRFFTVSWQQPETRFDYYKIEATGDTVNIDRAVVGYRPGFCGKGTILQPDHTRVTCNSLNACTTVSFTIRTYRNGPPELASSGATLSDIFIPSQDLDPPTNITMTMKTHSVTRLQWEAPGKASGNLGEYSVKVCDRFASCDLKANLTGCTNHRISATWLELASTVDTPYCVQVTASAWCGSDLITSRPAVAAIRTPLWVLPEVTNLSLVDVTHNSFTVKWERPERRLDHYLLDLKGLQVQRGTAGQHLLGSCAEGSILSPDQTRVTCAHLQPCSNLSFTVRTQIHGPPERTSLGVNLDGIFIPGRDPDPPKNISMLGKTPFLTLLRWEPPVVASGKVDVYWVKICDTFASCDERSVGGCSLFETSQASLEFSSTCNTRYCVFITATTQCGSGVLRSHPAVSEIKTSSFEPPDALNLRLEAVTPDSFTVGWTRPKGKFDSYRVGTMVDRDGNGAFEDHLVGSCAHGTYFPDNQGKVTCDNLQPCTNLTFTLHTLVKGPPERTSRGVNITSIAIPRKAPEPPSNITAYRTGATVQLKWKAPPSSVSVYSVKICDWCVFRDPDQCCWAKETSSPSLVFNRTDDEDYTVHVRAGASCRSAVTWSESTITQFLPVLPDVTNLSLAVVAKDSFTVTWSRPKSRFDYYLVKVNEYNTGSPGGGYQSAGSCTNGTIVHPDQTQVTCRLLETWCGKVSVTINTHRNRPNKRTSPGTTLRNIYVAGKAQPPDVNDLKLAALYSNSFTVSWKRPNGCFDSYMVDFIDGSLKSGGALQHRFGTCRNAIIGPEQTNITCKQLEACTNVSVRVRTQRDGPPRLTSPGVMLKGIFFPGGAPEGFSINIRRIRPDSVQVTIVITDMKPCMLGSCSGVLEGYNYNRTLSCSPNIWKPFRVALPRGPLSKRYLIKVTLTNPHNGLSSTKSASVGRFYG